MNRLVAWLTSLLATKPSAGNGSLSEPGETSMRIEVVVTGAVTVNIYEEADMSLISEKLDELEAAIKTEKEQGAALEASIETLNAQVAELQAKVDAGLVTPEELARLDALKAEVESIVNPK